MIKLALTTVLFITGLTANAARLKDIASLRGVRENQLIGYGLVIGLKGTGDTQTDYTNKSFGRFIEKLGVKITPDQVAGKNVAAVIITAKLPPFAKAGNP